VLVSGFTNDSGFITGVDWTELGGSQSSINLSGFTNDSGFITGIDWDQIGGDQTDVLVSGFTNDSGFITGISGSDVTTALGYTPEDAADKGQSSGYASLDGDALIPFDEIPTNTFGNWDASTNNPVLANDPQSHNPGDIYVVTVGGTQLGETFIIGDWVVFDGTEWVKTINTNVDWDQIGGDQTDVLVSGFTNDAGYLTSATLDVGWGDLTGSQSSINLSGFTNDSGFITEVDWTELGGSQSSINLSGFTNDSGFITGVNWDHRWRPDRCLGLRVHERRWLSNQRDVGCRLGRLDWLTVKYQPIRIHQ